MQPLFYFTNLGQIKVDRIKIHEEYVGPANGFKHDIALLRLSRPAVLTGDSVRTACLPANPAEVALKLGVADLGGTSLEGVNATLVGWGKVSLR